MAALDAAYDVEADDARWLTQVCEATRPLIDADDAGVHAFLVDVSSATPTLGRPLLRGGDASWRRRWRKAWWEPFMLAMDASAMRSVLSFAPVSYATDLYAATRLKAPTLKALLQRQRLFERDRPRLDARFEYPDSLNLVALDSGGKGLVLVANRREMAAEPPSRAQRTVLGALCAHLASAARLRRQLGARTSLLDETDAIVDERGRLVHLTSDAAGRGARQVATDMAPRLRQLRSTTSRPLPPLRLTGCRSRSCGCWLSGREATSGGRSPMSWAWLPRRWQAGSRARATSSKRVTRPSSCSARGGS